MSSCSQTSGVHGERETRLPNGQRSHQHVRSDQQQHKLRGRVHPRGRHQGPVEDYTTQSSQFPLQPGAEPPDSTHRVCAVFCTNVDNLSCQCFAELCWTLLRSISIQTHKRESFLLRIVLIICPCFSCFLWFPIYSVYFVWRQRCSKHNVLFMCHHPDLCACQPTCHCFTLTASSADSSG